MKVHGILLIETSLEGALAEESLRRTQIDTFHSMKRSFDTEFQLYYERIHDISGLRHVLTRCTLQNRQLRAVRNKDGLESEKTNIRFVHISSHGSKNCPELVIKAGNSRRASERDFVNAFSILKGSQIRALILSACQIGQNEKFAKEIIEKTGIKAVVAYPETAYDHVCAIAEQLLYYQLIRRRVRVWEAVRKVNDALVILGEKEHRLLACWSSEDRKFSGPAPWWGINPRVKDREFRSFISAIKKFQPKRGPIGEEHLSSLRQIVKEL